MLNKSLYLFLSKILGYGIRIILPVFLVRLLTKAEFGTYSQFFLLEMLIKTIFQMGINQSLFFFIPRDEKNAGAYFINSLFLNMGVFTLAYVVVWVFRFEIATQLGMVLVVNFFWYLAGYSMLMMLNIAAESYLIARQQIIPSSIYSVGREVLASIATLFAAFQYGDLKSIFLALIISRAITLILALGYIHFKLNGFKATKYFFNIRTQIQYGVVLGIAGTIGALSLRMHELAVSREFSLETYAIYAAGCKQIPILQFASQAISAVALSQFATLEKNGDWAGIKELWEKILASMYGVGVPITLFFVLIAEPLINLMFTSEYSEAIPVFRLNALAMMALILNPTLVLRAMDRNDVSLKINALILGLMPLSFYFGVKYFGFVGVIAAHVILINLGKFISIYFMNKLTPVYLPYFASRKNLLIFYKSVWNKGMGVVNQLKG